MSRRLATRLVAKPWGKDVLPAPFSAPAGERIGEIWFEPVEPIAGLLVKYIFTSEKLSVQVHPTDAQTLAKGLGRQGKEECWLVIHAEPGATLGIGFNRALSREEMRAAALDGSIEDLLTWFPVKPGDFFYIPANTVHAIGAGIGVIEIQQNSDITYRLYDYGRPRALHLDEGLAVAIGEPYPVKYRFAVPEKGDARLIEDKHFRLDRIDGHFNADVRSRYGNAPLLVIPLGEGVSIGGDVFAAGQCGIASSLADIVLNGDVKILIAQPAA